MRLGSANTFDNALEQLYKRQAELSGQQEKLTSGKKINRVSDDPSGAVQAERAMTRVSRIEIEQRALEIQRNALSSAESTLGNAGSLAQSFRDLVLAAGNGGYSPKDRGTLARQMVGLRDQLFALANQRDSNGVPLFGGLGSAGAPFVDGAAGVSFQGVPGQRASTEVSVPGAMDGQAVWLNVPTGNGVFQVGLGAGNTGSAWTDAGQVTTPGTLTGDSYRVDFHVAAGITTYDVVDSTTATAVASGLPYQPGGAIQFDGMSFVVRGAPQDADTLQIGPSSRSDLFQVLDDAIASIDGASGGNRLTQAVTLALSQIDAGMERLQAARSQAGEWLNRADSIAGRQESHSIQLEADRSRAEDLDMVKGISDFQKFQTGYQAALQSYAQVQRLSLFNFIN